MGKAVVETSRKHQSKASASRISMSSASESNYYDFPIVPTRSRSRSPDQPTKRSNKPMQTPEYSEVDPGNPLGNVVDLFVDAMSFHKPDIGVGSVLKPFTSFEDKDLQQFLEDCLLLERAGQRSKKSDESNVSQTSSGKRSKHGWRKNKFLLKPIVSQRNKLNTSSKAKTNQGTDDLWKGIVDEKEADVDDIITISMSDDDTLFIDLEEDNTWTTTPDDHHQKTLAIDISKVVASEEKTNKSTTKTVPSTSEPQIVDDGSVKQEEKPEFDTVTPWQILEAFFATNDVNEQKQTETLAFTSADNAEKVSETEKEESKEEPEAAMDEIMSTSKDIQSTSSTGLKSKKSRRKNGLRSSILAMSSRGKVNSSVSKSRRLPWKKAKFLKAIKKSRSSGDSITSDEDLVSNDDNSSTDDQVSEKEVKSAEILEYSPIKGEATDAASERSEGGTFETPSHSSASALAPQEWVWWFFNNMNHNEDNNEESKNDSGSQSLVDPPLLEENEDTTFTDDNTKDSGTLLSDNDTNNDSWIMSIDQLGSFSEDGSRKTKESDESSSSNSSSSSSDYSDQYQQKLARKKKSKKGFRQLSQTLRKSFSSIRNKNSMSSRRSTESPPNSETEPTLPSRNIVTVVTNQVANALSTSGQTKDKRPGNNSVCEESTASASSNSQSWTRDDNATKSEDYFYGFGFFQCHEVIRE